MKEEVGPCNHCKKMRHLIADYPSLQAATSRRVHKKKVMMATWDDSKSKSDKKVDTTIVCFIANRDDPTKVSLETFLDEDELTMNELTRFFEELQKTIWVFKSLK